MNTDTHLVITSIADSNNKILRLWARECKSKGIPFILIGDAKSPENFTIPGCDFYDLQDQASLPFSYAKKVPQNNYSRKNIGYLIAMQNNASTIIETDDDNLPATSFWDKRQMNRFACKIEEEGWINVYKYFSSQPVWPRGFAIEKWDDPAPSPDQLSYTEVKCPIQQGLADENPDVDAIYRLFFSLPLFFKEGKSIALGKKCWSPFNSQNTTWFREAFPLMYLPTYCSFRMTDIWRSFIAQRICWENNWPVLFHGPTVYQKRNDHNLLDDFKDEIQGYLNNSKIAKTLEGLSLKKGEEFIFENLFLCYDAMIKSGMIEQKEMELLNAWIFDLSNINYS